MAVHALFIAGVGLSSTFVNVYLWRHGGGLTIVARYHVALFLAFPVGAVAAGLLAARRDRIDALRWGVAAHALFFLSVLALGGRSPGFVWPLGVLMGLGMGFYYLGCSVLMLDLVKPGHAHRLVGAIDQARLAGMTLTPFLAGWAVDRLPAGHGYRAIFAASVVLFLVAVAFTRRVPRSNAGRVPLPLGDALVGSPDPAWRTYLVAQGWRGLRDGVFLFLAGVLVFDRARNELQLGLFALGTGALTWAATAWVTRRAEPANHRSLLGFGVAGSALAAAALVAVPGWPGIVAFGILESASLPLVAVPFSSASYVLAGKDRRRGLGQMVAREIPLNLGRLAGVALLLAALQWIRHPAAVPAVLAGVGLANLAALVVLRRGVV